MNVVKGLWARKNVLAASSKRIIPWRGAVGVLTLAALAGCRTTTLQPAADADTVANLEGAAESSMSGVAITVQSEPWPESAPIEQAVTPLRVRIDNNGESPLRIAYGELALVMSSGAVSSALPLYQIDAEVEEAVNINPGPIGPDPIFMHRGFAVAPYLGRYYPGFDVAGDPFLRDRYYYDTMQTAWVEQDLPTPAMIANALPEGELAPGGSLEGWLYFERVDDAAGRVIFRLDLVDARNGRKFGELRVPFTTTG